MSDSAPENHGLTEDDFKKFRAFTSGSKRASDLGKTAAGNQGRISADECEDLRSRPPSEYSIAELADEFGVVESVISRHRRGRCQHGQGRISDQ